MEYLDYYTEYWLIVVASVFFIFLLYKIYRFIFRKTFGSNVNLKKLDCYEFEEFVAEVFKRKGYSVKVTTKSADFGADVIAKKRSDKIVIQVKHYTGSVGNSAVQEAYTAINYYNCKRAMVVCSSYYTKNAELLAKPNNVELWDLNKLKSECKKVNINLK